MNRKLPQAWAASSLAVLLVLAGGGLSSATPATSAAPLGLQAFGDTLSIMHGPEATSLNVTTKLELQVADVELLQNFPAYGCNFLVSGGVRLARLNQTYNAYDAQSTNAREFRTLASL